MFGVADPHALRAAAAVELVHAYSLVHDDLPAMDDDDLRRGRPTVHVQYDEATAILAGDALQALAFEVLADAETHWDPQVRCDLLRELAVAAGAAGMVGGQVLDLRAPQETFDIGGVARLERLKTGALIAFSATAGAILGYAREEARTALAAFAHDIGFAFQIADDLLDAEGEEAKTGKRVGKDGAKGKETFVSLLGIERARQQANLLVDQAVQHLQSFGVEADLLRAIARFAVERDH
jgi:farnesyl diphosphate synthase